MEQLIWSSSSGQGVPSSGHADPPVSLLLTEHRDISLRLHVPTTSLVPPPGAGAARSASGYAVSEGDIAIGALKPQTGACEATKQAAIAARCVAGALLLPLSYNVKLPPPPPSPCCRLLPAAHRCAGRPPVPPARRLPGGVARCGAWHMRLDGSCTKRRILCAHCVVDCLW